MAGDFVLAALALEALDILESLGLGLVQVGSAALVLGQEAALPEKVYPLVGVFEAFDRLLERRHSAAADTEHVEKFVPEGLGLGAFVLRAFPLAGESDGALADFIPGKSGHGGTGSFSSERSNLTKCRANNPDGIRSGL
jgi:hypothetical protein